MGIPKGCKKHGSAIEEGHFCHFGLNGLRNEPSHLVGPPFSAFKARFYLHQFGISLRALIESSLSGGCGYTHVSA